eukprot:2119985-Prymnesium_polylepis.1
MGGAAALRAELEGLGIVAGGRLTTGDAPPNVLAKLAAGVATQEVRPRTCRTRTAGPSPPVV